MLYQEEIRKKNWKKPYKYQINTWVMILSYKSMISTTINGLNITPWIGYLPFALYYNSKNSSIEMKSMVGN